MTMARNTALVSPLPDDIADILVSGPMNKVGVSEFPSKDLASWVRRLGALNPWAPLPVERYSAEFVEAKKGAMLTRFGKGSKVWNSWAEEMLTLKAELREAGIWDSNPSDDLMDLGEVGENEATSQWIALAELKLPRHHDNAEERSFEDFIFPADVDFGYAHFSGDTDFHWATFHGKAQFVGATFSKDASFLGATFKHEAIFGGSKFGDRACFMRSNFFDRVDFEGVSFSEEAQFDEATFAGPADFSKSDFGSATFDHAMFKHGALFEATNCRENFSLANSSFKQVPSLIGATFRGILRLDNVETPKYRFFGWTSDKDAPARFRELRRRATESQDRDRELEFFAQEIRTSRFHVKRLPAFIPRVWEGRSWFGLLFGTFSDFGRSLWRPVLFWLALLLGFAAFYLGEHGDMRKARDALNPNGAWSTLSAYVQTSRDALAKPPACAPRGRELFASTDALTEAFQLSLRNALIFEGARPEASRRTYGCLYGLEAVGDQEYAKVSPRVSIASTLQSVASGVLIFLFLLAVRNLLRLK